MYTVLPKPTPQQNTKREQVKDVFEFDNKFTITISSNEPNISNLYAIPLPHTVIWLSLCLSQFTPPPLLNFKTSRLFTPLNYYWMIDYVMANASPFKLYLSFYFKLEKFEKHLISVLRPSLTRWRGADDRTMAGKPLYLKYLLVNLFLINRQK